MQRKKPYRIRVCIRLEQGESTGGWIDAVHVDQVRELSTDRKIASGFDCAGATAAVRDDRDGVDVLILSTVGDRLDAVPKRGENRRHLSVLDVDRLADRDRRCAEAAADAGEVVSLGARGRGRRSSEAREAGHAHGRRLRERCHAGEIAALADPCSRNPERQHAAVRRCSLPRAALGMLLQ